MVKFIRSDLDFILSQIEIAESNAAGISLLDLLPNIQVPFGLRTVDGSYNNLVFNATAGIDQHLFGAADTVFPRMLTPKFRTAEGAPANFFGPGSPATPPTSYAQISGNVFDSQPRTISNLIVDQTAGNFAATAAATATPGAGLVTSPGLDGQFGTADDKQVYFIPNVAPDAGLSAPFNAWFTFFGQFFDHGLDLVTKGGQDTIFIPLQPDDPLYVPGSPTNFMALTRATNTAVHPGPDGVLGTADDIHDNENTTTPFIDQNQTYTSHPSHQVFLRAYQIFNGAPLATGKLITNKDLGADGHFGGTGANADTELGGMATWKVVKAQARDYLGINLTDKDFDDVPLLATDAYGNFIKGPNGLPQVVMQTAGGDGIFGTADDGTTLVEGNRAAPIDLTHAVRTGHQFLIDVNHNAVPVVNAAGVLQPDADSSVGNAQPTDAFGNNLTYDNELLDAHYIAGDGRANENIGLTAVHSIFHSEHNRLVDQTKSTLIADAKQTGDVTFLNQWLLTPITTAALAGLNPANAATFDTLQWNGERLFQAARFGTEMQYQHIVFEEFARTVQPNVDEFLAPLGYDATINPAIVAEFAHTVYRFGHSMLTETVDRFDANFNVVGEPGNPDQQIGLIAAFLNPLEFAASGPTPEQAVSAIVRGVTRTVGNEIDEFVTEALRNNLLGTPLDLAVLNIARGRDAGIPSLNAARREFYNMTNNNDVGDANVKPYTSWVDFLGHLKHPESLVNFIAAYGTHEAVTSQTTFEGQRAAAMLLVLGDGDDSDGVTINGVTYSDRFDFLNSTGTWANNSAAHAVKDLDGVTTTGLGNIDFWVGGLAEKQMPFGGLLGSSFNFVFENQLEAFQNGDRFYYLARTAGLNFGTELENNTFSQLVMLNTDVKHLPANIFSTPAWTLEVDPSKQFTGLGAGRADPTDGAITINGQVVTPLVIRNNPATPGADSNYLQYTGEEHVVLGGRDPVGSIAGSGDDILISGDGDDTLWGDGGNDRLEGGFGNDEIFGGDGDDIITDMGGTDVVHGGAGNDVISDSHSLLPLETPNILLGGDGKDFIATWDDVSTIFGGAGDDFIYGSKPNLPETGNEGDDWIELGTQDGAPGDNFSPLLADDVPGNDIFVGGGGFDEMIGEGGDDIFVGSDAQDKMDGMSGFDWVTYKNDTIGVTVDLELAALNEPPVAASPASILDRFAEVEGLSGSRFADYLRGSEADANVIATFNAKTSALDAAGIARVSGLQALLDHAFSIPAGGVHVTGFGTGNIILGGDGSDIILPRGGDDVVDGDAWLNVRVSVRLNKDGSGPEIASYDSLAPLIPLMLNGTYNPGQLVAVREIMPGTANAPGRLDNFDTVVFQGPQANYSVTIDTRGTPLDVSDDVVTVADISANPVDGVDHLTHVERLQFADATFDLAPGLDAPAAGQPTISDPNGGDVTVGDFLDVSIAGVTDADNPGGTITGPIRYTWQSEAVPGSGIFDDIILLPGGDLAFESASGTRFRVTPDLAGLSLRVKAIYTDAHGVTEQVFSAATTPVVAAPAAPLVTPSTAGLVADAGGPGVKLVRSDLNFILTQIKIAEAHAAGTPLQNLIPNIRLAYGLRSVDGSENNLLNDGGFNQTEFGAADNTFPRLLPPQFHNAESGTSYNQTTGTVIDSQPRVISNLIVDQTAENPAAYATAYDPGANGHLDFGAVGSDDVLKDGVHIVKSPGLDGQFGTADDRDVFEFPNVTPDAGLSAPFNAWFTFFGQFFDHGLDLVTKGGNGTIFVPLKADDPLVAGADGIFGNADDLPQALRFMVETRATMLPGPDGVIGTADDIHENENTTTPFVDQNQTYTSHPSHQVFLRAYQILNGAPIATGKLITNRDLGADGKFGTADDHEIGGMSTWKVVKAQARDYLGINLTDKDFDNVPLLATDQYGNFIKGANGLPQVVMRTAGGDGLFGTADDGTTLVEGNRASPIDLTHAVRTGHQFLIDVAHNAVPVLDASGNLVADADNIAGNQVPFNPSTGANLAYDNELLDAHYIAGDGRVNENIGLTTVHSIFHSEHNRLADQAMDTVLASNDVAFLNEWLLPGHTVTTFPTTQAAIDALVWNGERLFQVAKFGTEMQYQHLVFEEFARTVQPLVNPFFAPTQVYDVNLNPSIVAEFAHTVYRFGHSMLTETVDRFDANLNVVGDPNSANPDQQLGLIAAFLNPLAFVASGSDPKEAASAIVRGVTRTVGNEIDEFVTEALRNNLLGTPLDLAVLNIARGRDTGIPTLNAARRDFYTQTGDSWVKPYTSWADLVQHLKHPESLINFIAAYGTHSSIVSATTLDAKRAAALAIVLGGAGAPADRLDFLNSTGTWANSNATHPLDFDGVSRTGLGNIDFWVGGLAEQAMPFGGLLGPTFNFVFENQLQKLQDADRFYYLERTSGLSFGNELESNSFAKLIMANTNATHLPALVFTTPAFTLEVDKAKQLTGVGAGGVLDPAGREDPVGGITIAGHEITPLVIRDNPNTVGPDTHYLQYTGEDHVVLGGTPGDDTIIGSIGDDTLWGDEGNDRLNGGYGNDNIRGGDGDDIITEMGGADNIQGGDGNDVIQGSGGGGDLILGGFGNDFIVTGEDNSEAFGGAGDDFILGNKSNEQDIGNEGDDWIEKGTSDGAPGDNFDPLGNDPIIGNDIFLGDGENDKFIGEGGDDIMVGSNGLTDRYFGGSGFDWATYKDDKIGVTIDFSGRFFDQPQVPGSGASALARFDIMEGLSGSSHDDFLAGDDAVDLVGGEVGAGVNGSALTNIALINGLQELLDTAFGSPVTAFTTGNIILGGAGSDVMMGRGGDDIIDGDAWLNVRISVQGGIPGHDSFDSMQDLVPYMLNGTYQVSQLHMVREILRTGTPGFDTAVFSGNFLDYSILPFDNDGNGVDETLVVTDNVGTDGTDRVLHVERLQFADRAVLVSDLSNAPPAPNSAPTGVLTINDTTPAEGQALTVSIAGVHDADNIGPNNATGTIGAPVSYFWQVETAAGTGIFEDITVFAAGEIARVEGITFAPTPDLAGQVLRVRAVYEDGHGTLEQVFSAQTAAVTAVNNGAASLTLAGVAAVGTTLTAVLGTDPDGAGTTPTFQWFRDGVAVGGATAATFLLTATDLTHHISVQVNYTDGQGFAEQVTSASTGAVGAVSVRPANIATTNTLSASNNLVNLFGTPIVGGITYSWETSPTGATWTNHGVGGTFFPGATGLGGVFVRADANFTDASASPQHVPSLAVHYLLDDATGHTLTGIAAVDFIFAEAGDDTVSAGGGDDSVSGGLGNDTFVATVSDGNDRYDGGGGSDTYDASAITTAVTINLNQSKATGVDIGTDTLTTMENATGGSGNDLVVGNTLGNVLVGGAGNDQLNGNAGADTMSGGSGNDTYNVDNAGDVVTEAAGQGNDRVLATVSYTLTAGSEVETLQSQSVAGLTLTGNEFNNAVIGGAAGDTLVGAEGNDTLTGNGGNDSLDGGLGNDVLNGGAGADTMAGGSGNDTYSVDNAGDVVTEAAGQGNDRVLATVSYTLTAGSEVETLQSQSVAGLTLTGNEFNNAVIGGAAGDTLVGAEGNDTLTGNGGNDSLDGGLGNDVLNGGAGADTMAGGAGNDTYSVDNAGDLVTEAIGGGADTVQTTVSYALAAGSEVEVLRANAGATPLSLTGNEFANNIVGGTGKDTLSGGGGNDTLNGGVGVDSMAGGAGNDTYNVDNVGDVVTEATGDGTDTVQTTVSYALAAGSEIEFLRVSGTAGLSLTGNEFANTLVGGNGADTLIGGAGNDVLNSGAGNDLLTGGAGNDTMNGGAGADVFSFVAGFGNDLVGDFTLGQDKLDLSGLGITAAAGNFSALASINAAGTATITIGTGTIRLNGITAVALHATDPSVFVA